MEQIYYVTKNDEPTGETAEKYSAHTSQTKLHAAFSCYVFNEKGEVLVTQRAAMKKVWPNVWTNSCCGHPFPDETREDALHRRMEYELGMKVNNVELILPEYTYKTPPYNGIVEHEYCPVFVAIAETEPIPNPSEVSAYKWVGWDWFKAQTEHDSDDYTNPDSPGSPTWSWWSKDQIEKLLSSDRFNEFLNRLKKTNL